MTYILTWNKDKWPEEKMQELMDTFSKGEDVIHRWKFGSHKKGGIGDKVFLSRTGKSYAGLIGSGKIVSIARKELDFEDPLKEAWYVDVRFDFLSKSPTHIVVSHYDLAAKLDVEAKSFTPQKSGSPYSGNAVELENYWSQLIGEQEIIYACDVKHSEEKQYIEGALKTIVINRYERDPEAREECIKHHGSSCKACGFNFGIIYGPVLGKKYIHIHHLVPLKDIRKEYRVNPIKDLVPLCANCHSMVHQTNPPMTISDLSEVIMPRYLSLFN